VNPLHLETVDEKRVRLSNISPLLAHCLFEVPEILRLREQSGPHQRLFPDPIANDAESNAEWHRLMDGEFHHLFASADEIIVRDLTQLDPVQGHVTFPAEHINAWMSALNQARLILGAKFQVRETDMDRQDLDIRDPREKALLQIHLLGWLLQLFVEHENPDAA
jgi:hypothetical protein